MSDPVVFITGASSGIGAAVAREYAKRGYRVALCARRKDRIDELSHGLGGQERAQALECDVTLKEDLEAAVAEVKNKYGRIDVVFANAGYGRAGSFEKLTVDDYRKQFETNVFGVLNTIYATLDLLKASKGKLALVGSVNSYVSEPKKTPYSMSKFAVRALAEGLYWEMLPLGVSVSLICPGLVESEIRKLDKNGILSENATEQAPAFLIMPARKAATQIVEAIEKREKEKVITAHGKLAVFLQRHMPITLTPLFRDAKAFSRK